MPAPLGVDVARPRLSFSLTSGTRGQRPTAYQIRAVDGAGRVAWDSGKVPSPDTILVEWGGRALRSADRITWRARAWDAEGRGSDWSAPETFEMGLLAKQDWKGEWIAGAARQDYLPPTPLLDGKTRFVWGGDEPGGSARHFRARFDLPEGKRIRSARGVVAAAGGFVLYVNGLEAARGQPWGEGAFLTPVSVTPIYAGTNVLSLEAPRPADGAAPWLAARIVVELAEGPPLVLDTGSGWKASATAPEGWKTAAFDDAGWIAAREVQRPVGPLGRFALPPQTLPAPLLRKTFTLDKPVARARAYVAGLGYHELHLNGRRVGDHVLDPGFTRYDRRALYVVHDVTSLLRPGANAVGVMLGNGFWNTHWQDVWDFHKSPWRATPRLLAQLHVTYADGTSEIVATDGSWRASTGPVVSDGVRNGESYDARLERRGWTEPGYDDAGWARAATVPGPAGALSAQLAWPIKVTETLKPKALREVRPGVFVFDLGQNFAGWARLRVRGPAGTTITLRYGERLYDDGRVSREKLSGLVQQGPFQTDSYTLRGGGQETWEPRFTYHGFQYVEVTGWPGRPTLESLDGRVVHTAFPQIGHFASGDPALDALFRATLWSYRSNFHSVPTDCPHREKNGWTADAHLATEVGLFTFDAAAAYDKWVRDLADEQRSDGALPGIVPTSGWGYTWGNGPAWDSALLLVPWYLHVYRGDARVLTRNYDGFKRYVDYVGARGYFEKNPAGWLGDWVRLEQETPEAVTHAGFHARDAGIVAATARLLGKADEARAYEGVADGVRKQFAAKFVDAATGTIATGSQTAQACALYEDMLGPELREKARARLIENIEGQKGHLEAGVLGAKCLPWVLTAAGRADLVHRMATARDFPGWSNWLARGATTLWEDWKGGASRNHIFLGDITAWFFRALAGINPDPAAPGFARIVFRPEWVTGLPWVRAETMSPRGKVASAWRRTTDAAGNLVDWSVTVPVGSVALVQVPAPRHESVTAEAGARFLRSEGGRQLYEVGSGTWRFVVR
jgi:alpha-L-rhamnosidase